MFSKHKLIMNTENRFLIKKTRNAYKMFHENGVNYLWHKVKRFFYHKLQFIIRKTFYPKAGYLLRKTAQKEFVENKLPLSISIVIPVLGQHSLTKLCLNKIAENQMGDIEVVIIDNGGDFEIKKNELSEKITKLKIIRPSTENTGVYPTFKYGMDNTAGDIVLFIHSDLLIDDNGFDTTLRYVFAKDKNIGLLGFVGSDEINENGSRAWGTTSNFLGKTYSYNNETWKGLPSSFFGITYDGLTKAVVLDGCAMAINRDVWNKIGYRENRPPHHYYDRFISCQVLEIGYDIWVLGIGCDHIGGQVASKEKKYFNTAKMWCQKNNIEPIKDDSGNINWDITMHTEAKRLFLKEWRDEKKFIPREI